jgi:hypothetical protein
MLTTILCPVGPKADASGTKLAIIRNSKEVAKIFMRFWLLLK